MAEAVHRRIAYVAALMHPEDEKAVLTAAAKLGLPSLVNKLHLTLVYSEYIPTIEAQKEYKDPIKASFKRLVCLPSNQDKKTMVAIEWESEGLSKRHEEEMKKSFNGKRATQDYSPWTFHTTLTYKTGQIPDNVDPKDLFPSVVRFTGEEYEDFTE